MTFHHVTNMQKRCPHCGEPFLFFWKDAEERNGWSESMYGEYHLNCHRALTGQEPKTLQQLNEERRQQAENNL